MVKRWGFHGSPASHGHKDQLRMPGSIASRTQGPVAKGKKMGGHMGTNRVSVHNIAVVDINPEAGLLYLKGAIPGARGSVVLVKGLGEMVVEKTKKQESEKTEETPAEPKAEVVEEVKEAVVEESKAEEKVESSEEKKPEAVEEKQEVAEEPKAEEAAEETK